MKIGLYQMNIAWEDKLKNYSQLENILKEQGDKTIDLLLLPEMSFTGFSMNTARTKESDMQTIDKISSFAKTYRMAIGFGWVKDCGEKSENHYTVINREGLVVSDYVKIHPFSFSGEDRKFQGGENIVLFELGGITFSTCICSRSHLDDRNREGCGIVGPCLRCLAQLRGRRRDRRAICHLHEGSQARGGC